MKTNIMKIHRNHKIAISYYTMQILFTTLLFVNNCFERFNFFQTENSEYFECVIAIIIFVINIGSVFVIKCLCDARKEEEEMKLNLLKYQHIEEENRIYLRHRHDMKNHLLIILKLIQEKEYNRLEEYLLLYQKNIANSIIHIETGMKELDILFYSKANKARENDIQVEIIRKMMKNTEFFLYPWQISGGNKW